MGIYSWDSKWIFEAMKKIQQNLISHEALPLSKWNLDWVFEKTIINKVMWTKVSFNNQKTKRFTNINCIITALWNSLTSLIYSYLFIFLLLWDCSVSSSIAVSMKFHIWTWRRDVQMIVLWLDVVKLKEEMPTNVLFLNTGLPVSYWNQTYLFQNSIWRKIIFFKFIFYWQKHDRNTYFLHGYICFVLYRNW